MATLGAAGLLAPRCPPLWLGLVPVYILASGWGALGSLRGRPLVLGSSLWDRHHPGLVWRELSGEPQGPP